MIEKIVLDYLLSKGLNAYMQVPSTEPSEYVLIEKTGSSKLNLIKSATIAIQSYADSLFEAASLNESVIETMESLAALPEIVRCHLETDYQFTDTTKKKYRYQAQFSVTYY